MVFSGLLTSAISKILQHTRQSPQLRAAASGSEPPATRAETRTSEATPEPAANPDRRPAPGADRETGSDAARGPESTLPTRPTAARSSLRPYADSGSAFLVTTLISVCLMARLSPIGRTVCSGYAGVAVSTDQPGATPPRFAEPADAKDCMRRSGQSVNCDDSVIADPGSKKAPGRARPRTPRLQGVTSAAESTPGVPGRLPDSPAQRHTDGSSACTNFSSPENTSQARSCRSSRWPR